MREFAVALKNGTMLFIKAQGILITDANQIRFYASEEQEIARFDLTNIAGFVEYPFLLNT